MADAEFSSSDEQDVDVTKSEHTAFEKIAVTEVDAEVDEGVEGVAVEETPINHVDESGAGGVSEGGEVEVESGGRLPKVAEAAGEEGGACGDECREEGEYVE